MGLMEVVFRCVSVFVDKQHIHKLSVLSDGKGIKITNLVCTGNKQGLADTHKHTQPWTSTGVAVTSFSAYQTSIYPSHL